MLTNYFQVNDTANEILETFTDRIIAKDWLDDVTKERCIDKVHSYTVNGKSLAYNDLCNSAICSFVHEFSIPYFYTTHLQVEAITRQIAYPDFIKVDSELNKYYEKV